MDLGIMQEQERTEIFSKASTPWKINNVETKLKDKNGKIIYALLSSEIIILQDKKIRYTIVHDITVQKDLEQYTKQKLYYTNSINRIAEVIISYYNSQEIFENLNRIIGETLNIDRGMIYEISFEKNTIITKSDWINQDADDNESDVENFNSFEMFSMPLKVIKKSQKYLRQVNIRYHVPARSHLPLQSDH